jgi:acyl-CoA hydrolase
VTRRSDWASRAGSAAEVVAHVRSGMTVFLHGAAATPTPLLEALAARTDLEGVRVVHLHTEGPAPHAAPGRGAAFRAVSLFLSSPLRQAVAEGRADFVPVFLSDVPRLFASGQLPLDVAVLQLSPRTAMGCVPWAPPATPPGPPPTRPASSWRRSTSGCRGRTGTPPSPSAG